MTTPTREQVAQWGETQYSPNFMKMNIKYMTALYELARADIEATIAEQAKQLEEMAEAVRVKDAALHWISKQKATGQIQCRASEALAILPSPEILAARDQRVAEACARYVEPPVDLEDRDLLGGQEGRQLLEGTAEAIRAGKWREFL